MWTIEHHTPVSLPTVPPYGVPATWLLTRKNDLVKAGEWIAGTKLSNLNSTFASHLRRKARRILQDIM